MTASVPLLHRSHDLSSARHAQHKPDQEPPQPPPLPKLFCISAAEPASIETHLPGNDDFVPCSDAVVPPTTASQNPTPSPLEPSTEKRKPYKKESDVWEHFEKYDLVLDLKGVDETKKKEVEKRAKCKYCSATYASDTKKNGTSNMWKHLNKKCLHYPYMHKDKNTRTLAFDASKGNALVSRNFNKDDCLDACIRMVVGDELPFSFVEGEGFRESCSVACPQFNPPSRRTLGRRFLEMYTQMKEKLKLTFVHIEYALQPILGHRFKI
ncbi:hypothetical protein L3X38_017222 [Prunus dulcis]|uniref:BED-type domain-containing protein n=1 Tax=Prunus dulcis TaxID=3755 RepID=A0AAD4W9B6_PRUDU|nr:hypothetical protein L3X38_017222 [Prunus dulcis]